MLILLSCAEKEIETTVFCSVITNQLFFSSLLFIFRFSKVTRYYFYTKNRFCV